MKSWIYFAQHGNEGPIKIGRAHDPRKRVLGLAIGSPVALVLLGAVLSERAEEEEAEIHARLREYCVRGEWFIPEGALREMEALNARMVTPEALVRLEPVDEDAYADQLNFRLPSEELPTWKAAARREGVSLSRWARDCLNAAALGEGEPEDFDHG